MGWLMKPRLLLALGVFLGVTAFAPAPFPKLQRERDRNEIDMEIFQGTWGVVSMEIVQQGGGRNRLTDWGIDSNGTTAVQIRGDRWTYLSRGQEMSSYRMNIDTGKPAGINWYTSLTRPEGGQEAPGMFGLIRREGNRVTILYQAIGSEQRPKTFDDPPNGWWILTLKR
jgi:uncharacterized protein (TIGR03067 family)